MFGKFACLLVLLFVSFANSQTVRQYADASCTTLVATMPMTLGACMDTSSGGSQSSMRYSVCNSTAVITEGFANNNCAGSVMFSMNGQPNVCQNQMIISCSTPSPPSTSTPTPAPPTNSNGWIVTIKSYNDNSCQTLATTQTATVGVCKDFSASGSTSSGMFLSCNTSVVSGNMYANNNCAGNPATALSSPVGTCVNREIVTCAAPTKTTSLAQNPYYSVFVLGIVSTILLFFAW